MNPERSVLVRRPLVAERRLVRPPAPIGAPFVKWAGGKTRLLDELALQLPDSFGRYFEPFVGGGALFFHLAPPDGTISDANVELMFCYRAVRDDVEGVIAELARHEEAHEEAHYYDVRRRWNAGQIPPGTPERAAAFIYLNHTCYNGLWRVNSRGEFNVPMGRYARPNILDADRLRAASRALAGTSLAARSFERVLDDAGPGDLVYFDPPYDPVSGTANFTSYTSTAFGPDDQRALARVFRELSARGCAVMLSNSDTPFVRELYDGFRLTQVRCARAINSRADARGVVSEVIVTNT